MKFGMIAFTFLFIAVIGLQGGAHVGGAADVDDEALFYYYNMERRIETINTLEKALNAKYGLLDIKRHRLGIDVAKIFNDARAGRDISKREQHVLQGY